MRIDLGSNEDGAGEQSRAIRDSLEAKLAESAEMSAVRHLIGELEKGIKAFPYVPATLVADMALVGFAIDVVESAEAAVYLSRTNLPRRAFPNIRAAFESAQQVVLLATDNDYEFAGARAWVHYLQCDAAWLAEACPESSGVTNRDDADAWYEHRTDEIANVWNSICPGQGRLIEDAVRALAPKNGQLPGHWLGVGVVRELQKRYELLAPVLGGQLAAESARLNRGIYAALSRETHARRRLDPSAIQHLVDGTINVHARGRNDEANRKSILGCLETSIMETLAGLSYQLASRAA